MKSKHYGYYGNDASYLAGRIARDRPDILERMKAGEFKSVRAAAIEAGIVRVPHDDDVALERLVGAWLRADLETRQLFFWLVREEIEAPEEQEPRGPLVPKRGPHPYQALESTRIPELEKIVASLGVTGAAKAIGVTYRTVCRWRLGQTKPATAVLDHIRKLAAR